MKRFILLCAGAAALAAQSYRAEILAGPGVAPEDKLATEVTLRGPTSAVRDAAGALLIADNSDHRILRVNATGRFENVAGTGLCGRTPDGAQARNARICSPAELTPAASGDLYFAEDNPPRVRRISRDGTLSTVAGGGTATYRSGTVPATSVIVFPSSLALDEPRGLLYVADNRFVRVYRVDLAAGTLTGWAGTGEYKLRDVPEGDGGPATATPVLPNAIALDRAGDLLVADQSFLRRIIRESGIIRTFAGKVEGSEDDGVPALDAAVFATTLALDTDGAVLYSQGSRVRRIDPVTQRVTSIAGSLRLGPAREGPATASLFESVWIAAGAAGEVLLTDLVNRQAFALRRGTLTRLAGAAPDEVPPPAVALWRTRGVFLAESGEAWLGDDSRLFRFDTTGRLRNAAPAEGRDFFWTPRLLTGEPEGRVILGGSTTWVRDPAGTFTRLPGSGAATAVAADRAGGLLTTSILFRRYARLDLQSGRETPLLSGRRPLTAGVPYNGEPIVADGGSTSSPNLTGPSGPGLMRLLPSRVEPLAPFEGLWAGDGGPLARSSFGEVSSIAADRAGNLYLVDRSYRALRRVNPEGIVTSIAGPATVTEGSLVAADSRGNLLLSAPESQVVYRLTPLAVRAVRLLPGDGAVREPGARVTLSAFVEAADGGPAIGVTVAFRGLPGAALGSVITANDGTASVEVVLPASGEFRWSAAAGGQSAEAALRVSSAASSQPRIAEGGIAGAGLSNQPVIRLSPGGLASLFGQDLAPAGPVRTVTAGDVTGGRLPTSLNETCVLVGEVRAPLTAVSAGQINFQMPDILPGGRVPVRAVRNCGAANEVVSEPRFAEVALATPELLTFGRDAGGARPVAAVHGVSGVLLGRPDALPGLNLTPARPGDVVLLYAVGLGPARPAAAPGTIAASATELLDEARVSIGDRILDLTDILYAGLAPGFAGLYQLNVRLPGDIPAGSLPVTIEILGPPGGSLASLFRSGARSPAGPYLEVIR